MNSESQLSYLDNNDRLKIYQAIVDGCSHMYSKNKLQKEKFVSTMSAFMELADKDPYFLAHFTSYAIKKLDSKDLKVVSIFANSLSDADGTPFVVDHDSAGRPVFSDKFKKPNLRIVSQAALQGLDPKLVKRVIELANTKISLGARYKEGTHFSNSLKSAVKKWVKFREKNPKALEGIKKSGFAPTVQDIYRKAHLTPSDQAAEIFGWKQASYRCPACSYRHAVKKGSVCPKCQTVMQSIGIEKKNQINFKGLSDIEIAQKIRGEKISALVAMTALPDKMSPVVAVAILEQCTGNQAVILRGLFDGQGLLKDKEVLKVFENKIVTAKTALDRVDKINTEIDQAVEQTLKRAKAEKRKKDVGDIGKVFVHIDISGSMTNAIQFAKERGAIIAECVQNPQENFFWGAFNTQGFLLEKPTSFEKDAFMAALYGVTAGGGTNCLACYRKARELGCDVDVFITDQKHTGNSVKNQIEILDRAGVARPKAVVIVDFSRGMHNRLLKDPLEALGISVSIIRPEALTESALVTQAVKTAIVGAATVIDDIMNTELLKLPDWWLTV